MAVRLSALRAGRSLFSGKFLVLIYVRSWRLERLGQKKNPMEPAIFTNFTYSFALPAYVNS
jgi:hypothetical protein